MISARGSSCYLAILGVVLWLACLSAGTAWAEEPQAAAATAAAPTPALDRADNAWMLISSALVLMMTGPGLALFYSGLVRKKNVLGVMMQCIFLMCLMTVIWALWGYTLGFGGDTLDTPPKWIGNFDHLLHEGRASRRGKTASRSFPCIPLLTINRLTHMLFQGMFFIITPALDLRGVRRADEVQHDGRVHDPLGHAGLLPACAIGFGAAAFCSTAARMPSICCGGALDFAGGTVVHISSGVSALGLRLGAGQTIGLRQRADAAAQSDLHRHRRGDALGRLVRLQCRQRPERQRTGGQRLLRHAFRRGRRRIDLGRHRMDHPRQAVRSWAPAPAWWPGWSASRRPPDLSRRCPPC